MIYFITALFENEQKCHKIYAARISAQNTVIVIERCG